MWFLVAVALAGDRPETDGPETAAAAAWVAPGPAELVAVLDGLETRVARAEAIGVAAERLQNRWGLALAAGARDPCAEPGMSSVAGRILVFAPTWRDAVQSARAQDVRLVDLMSAPTVAPLLDADAAARVTRVRDRASRQVAAWLEYAAWHDRWFVPTSRGCQFALVTAAGEPAGGVPSPTEAARGVAIIGVGGGTICPDGIPADGRVALLAAPRACMAHTTDCECQPAPVAPGAVLFGR